MTTTDVFAGFSTHEFSSDGMSHRYYRLGTGPAVVVIAEIPGITPKVIEFARRVADAGMTVYLPSLFGTDGASPVPSGPTDVPRMAAMMTKSLGKICVSKEFTWWAVGKSSPVVVWLRALAAKAHDECGGPGVGAIGMCVSGGFALAPCRWTIACSLRCCRNRRCRSVSPRADVAASTSAPTTSKP